MTKILAVLALASGCSIALQSKPKTAGADCSTSHAYWIADAVGVAAGVAAIAAGLYVGGQAGNVISGPGALGSVLYLASAHNGYKWRAQCEAHTEPVAVR